VTVKLSMTNVAATKRELAEIAERDPDLASSSLAAAALTMARGMDSSTSVAQKSLAAKELANLMGRLQELAPKAKRKDRVDDLTARRAERRGTAAAG
jgi:hypothetical protein